MTDLDRTWQLIAGWTDRFLDSEIKRDPTLHLQAQVSLLMAVPGSAVAVGLLLYSANNPSNSGLLAPFFVGQVIVCLTSISACYRATIRYGLVLQASVTTAMIICGSFLSGGFNNVSMCLMVAMPVIASVLAGTVATAVTGALCVTALLIFGLLSYAGFTFPVIAEQTPLLWVLTLSWGVITTTGIAIFSSNRFSRTITAYESEISRRKRVEQNLRRTQQRLRLAKGAAEAGASAKGAFLAQVSHEIRNPLTAIMGSIDLLELPANDELRRARLAMLRRSADTLLELVDDVLDFSKIEAGKLILTPRPIDPRALVDQAERAHRLRAIERGLDIFIELPPDLPDSVTVDALRVKQVLNNLLSNAIKFTPSGSITIEVWFEDGSDTEAFIGFGVEDTGIGIPEEAKNQIFEPYVQAERSTTEQYGGTGLGLPICSRLVGLMGGTFGVESEPGEGSRFWFSVPAHAGESTHAATAAIAADLHGVKISQPSDSAHVLVVEDDGLNRQVVGDLLISLGHRVTLATSGLQGINSYINDQPDLVLMDIQMPEMNGMEATAQIREWETQNDAQRVPILAMTADVEVHRVARYGAAGMNDLLGKPISREKLEAAVHDWAVNQGSVAQTQA